MSVRLLRFGLKTETHLPDHFDRNDTYKCVPAVINGGPLPGAVGTFSGHRAVGDPGRRWLEVMSSCQTLTRSILCFRAQLRARGNKTVFSDFCKELGVGRVPQNGNTKGSIPRQ